VLIIPIYASLDYLTPKPDKVTKEQNYRTKSLIDIHSKFLNKCYQIESNSTLEDYSAQSSGINPTVAKIGATYKRQ
jgi:hypothetical protein